MLQHHQRNPRSGSVLPVMAAGMVGLCGFTALAVDLGMVMVAKTQAQNSADAAAFAGARSLSTGSSGNLTTATTNAKNVAVLNKVLGQAISNSNITVTHGAYHYDMTAQTFSAQYPPVAPDNYNLTKVSLTMSNATAFARVFNMTAFNVTATGTAAHRPRDVAMVLDFSGSMNNESDLWNNEGYLGSANNSPNNTDPVFPEFGVYDKNFSPLATLQCTSTDARVGKCNITQSVLGIAAMVDDYYQNGRGSSASSAFAPAPATITNTSPGGDKHLTTSGNTGSTAALHPYDIMGSTNNGAGFEGYAKYLGNFKGYTQGPGYWGMTFFIWPPDPTNDSNGVSNDWRKRFFFLSDGTTPLNDNRELFGTNGVLNDPAGNYVINYKAILAWISANCIQASAGDGKPFPPVLRAGNILYYDAVPTDVPTTAYDHTTLNSTITDANQRFWKEYIDFVIGVWRDPYGNIQRPGNPSCSYGPDFTPGTSTGGQGIQITGPDALVTTGTNKQYATVGKTNVAYINSKDNPKRPRHRFWFGPMTMIQYLSDTGTFPGVTHDISMVAAKLGIQGALTDIQNNHPNDMVSMLMFSRPHYSGEPTEAGQFTLPQFSLSRDYTGMIKALWYPPNSSSADVRPWDANGMQTPRAHGDYNANTATSYGLMLAYNQFSSDTTLRSQALGGLGRKGAQRLVILETDGMANVATSAGFTASGLNSHYNLGPSDSVSVSGTSPGQDAIDVATKIVALTTDTTNGPGFSTPSKAVTIHCIAFGAIFESTASGSEATSAMSLLQTISTLGGTGFPSSVNDTGTYAYKLCTGTLQQRQDKLRQAFSKIMDDGISIILVK